MDREQRAEFDGALGMSVVVDQAAALVAFDEVEFRKGR